jgi:hypothetical protein
LAGDGSHSTDNHQEEGRATVQAELSRQEDYLSKNSQGKTEYSNTQQGLPVHGILSHIARLMMAFRVLGKVFS